MIASELATSARCGTPEPLLNDTEAARFLGGLHPKTVQRMARRGELPAYRIGKYWRYRASELSTVAHVTFDEPEPVCSKLKGENSLSRRYQQGCLYREKRKAGPDVWVFRYRNGQTNRKQIIGTVKQFPSRKAAMKACEPFRANINQDTRPPRTVAELVGALPTEGNVRGQQ